MPHDWPAIARRASPVSTAPWGCLVVLALLACARAAVADDPIVDPRFVLTDSAETHAPAGGKAVICLVREQYVRERPLPPELIYLDGAPAGLLPQRTWFEVQVDPGPHRLCGLVGDPGFALRCHPGRTYLLRLREVIDSQDQLRENWLFDDASTAPDLVRKHRLRHVATTEVGLRFLSKKKRAICPNDTADAERWPAASLPDSFDHVLLERPLDQVNLENDFSQLFGQVSIDTAGIHYRLSVRVRASLDTWKLVTDSLDIPADRIVDVRFGGMRFTGVNPWVDVYHRTDLGVRIASFADTRETDGASTYDGVFAAIEELKATRRPREANDSQPEP
jgi:hypothetical protein